MKPLVKRLAIPLGCQRTTTKCLVISNQKTVTKWLVITIPLSHQKTLAKWLDVTIIRPVILA